VREVRAGAVGLGARELRDRSDEAGGDGAGDDEAGGDRAGRWGWGGSDRAGSATELRPR